ncbi:MAG: zinc ribbon domain-containing protein [Oscillospiraceae bacterium]|nr:zinc ribbon domain-containing protein [Oscillospiraceae bacterium]
MFCANCGKELQSTGEFCSHCGKRVGAEKRTVTTTFNQPETLVPGLRTLKGNAGVFFASVVLLIISVFLVGQKMFVVSYRAFSTQYLEFTMFEEKEFLKVLFVLGYIGSATMMLMPLFTGRDWENFHFVPGICMQMAAAIMLFITFVVVSGKMNTEEIMEAVDASISMTTNAWMLIMVIVGNIVLLVKACSDVIFTQEYWYRKNLQEEK